MKHTILRTSALLLIAGALSLTTARAASPEAAPEVPATAVSALAAEVEISAEGNVVTVRGAQGLSLEVFDITGKRVVLSRIDAPEKRITLNLPKGCYIVKAGKVVRKVYIA